MKHMTTKDSAASMSKMASSHTKNAAVILCKQHFAETQAKIANLWKLHSHYQSSNDVSKLKKVMDMIEKLIGHDNDIENKEVEQLVRENRNNGSNDNNKIKFNEDDEDKDKEGGDNGNNNNENDGNDYDNQNGESDRKGDNDNIDDNKVVDDKNSRLRRLFTAAIMITRMMVMRAKTVMILVMSVVVTML